MRGFPVRSKKRIPPLVKLRTVDEMKRSDMIVEVLDFFALADDVDLDYVQEQLDGWDIGQLRHAALHTRFERLKLLAVKSPEADQWSSVVGQHNGTVRSLRPTEV